MNEVKVLLVDDSLTELANLKSIVEKGGYEVVTATSGLEALEKAKQQQPDIILMDVVMEGTDGYSATKSLSLDAQTKDIPVVFVTSRSQKADRVWGELQGGRGLIAKPYTPEQILDRIENIA